MPAPRTVVLINAFEVPLDADEPFIAGWERARDFRAMKEAYRGSALHRALRSDVDFRFVDVADVDSPQAWRDAVSDPAFPGGGLPFPAHPGLYEVVLEDGAFDTEGGVILISPFEVGADADDRFLAGWNRARELLAGQQGHIGTRLHRSLGPADFRFVDIARWSSPLMFARTLQRPEFQAAAEALPFTSHRALY